MSAQCAVDTAKKRLEKTREAIVKSGSTMGIAIDGGYHALRLEELQLTADHHLRVEQEKELAREERHRLREEARAQEEFKRRKKDLLVLGASRPSPDHIIRWSIWRREHQATARHHYYRRRSEDPGLDLRL